MATAAPSLIRAPDGAGLFHRDWGKGLPHGLFLTHMDRLNADLLAFAREG